MKRKHMPGCKCCGNVICPGPCGDIVYASADVVIDAVRANCDQSMSFVIGSTLPELFSPRFPVACDKTWLDTSICSPPYSLNYIRQVRLSMAYLSPTQLRVMVEITAWADALPIRSGYHRFGRTFTAPTSCEDWLTPIALNLEVLNPDVSGYNVSGVLWNLSL